MDSASDHSLFDLLVLSLGNAALVGLGFVPDPDTGVIKKDILLAQHNIEFLAVLQSKTQGNLTPAESTLLSDLLYDLRMKFIEARQSV